MMPYRDAMLVPPQDTTPPWWQRVWFSVARDDAAQWWQWARRAIGGRWSWVYFADFVWGWERLELSETCPAQSRSYDVWCALVEDPDGTKERFGECSRRRCSCEVWP